MNLEIEKRFLLKNIPQIEFDQIHVIVQDYCPTGRLRHVKAYDTDPIVKQKYIKEYWLRTIKKDISPGVCEENEIEISKEEYDLEVSTSKSFIEKTRLIKYIENDLKWEIDIFKTVRLIIAEIELKAVENLETFVMHDYIEAVAITDITGKKKFSNRALSKTR